MDDRRWATAWCVRSDGLDGSWEDDLYRGDDHRPSSIVNRHEWGGEKKGTYILAVKFFEIIATLRSGFQANERVNRCRAETLHQENSDDGNHNPADVARSNQALCRP